MRTVYQTQAIVLGIFISSTAFPMTVTSQEITPSSDLTDSVVNVAPAAATLAMDIETAITFSEYVVNTYITNQYANRGIVFGGDAPFVSSDSANPTSPVLSGSPRFRGAIEGRFVNPADGKTPAVVQSFTLDWGYFDELYSTRMEWFDPAGKKLGQRTNTRLGIERITVEGGNIARWRTSIILTEPAGYAVDNVSFTPVEASVLFREKLDGEKDGTWGLGDDEIPGWDHVGLHILNAVYESHPGYPSGLYVSEDGKESVNIMATNGVQQVHTKGTFKHDVRLPEITSPVLEFEEIPINKALAEKMKTAIETKIAEKARFGDINFDSVDDIERTLSPAAQKGGNGTFTCVGLVEWAAERAGRNGGQGFIPNAFESIVFLDISTWPPKLRTFPLLSPQLLHFSMKSSQAMEGVKQWFQGVFDPVDFMITDPLGRRLGYTSELGEKNEIPGAFLSKNGNIEQFFIPNPVPGEYKVDFVGLGKPVVGAVASGSDTRAINKVLDSGTKDSMSQVVELMTGTRGDVNSDGCINSKDLSAISARLNSFATGTNDSSDINGDGLINEADRTLLSQLTALNPPCAKRSLLPILNRR